jgi:hypothetical protein
MKLFGSKVANRYGVDCLSPHMPSKVDAWHDYSIVGLRRRLINVDHEPSSNNCGGADFLVIRDGTGNRPMFNSVVPGARSCAALSCYIHLQLPINQELSTRRLI